MLKQSKKSIPEVNADYTAFNLHTDAAGIILSASVELLSFTGKRKEELIGASFRKIIDAADKPRLQALLNTGNGTGMTIQLLLKGKAGVRAVGFNARYIKSSTTNTTTIAWNAVTETKSAIVTTGSHQLLDKLFRFSSELLCLISEDGVIKKVNQTFATLLGYTASELTGSRFIQLVHPGERYLLPATVFLPVGEETNETFINTYCDKNGLAKKLGFAITWLAEEQLMLAIGHEITAPAAQLADTAPVMIWAVNEQDETIYVNEWLQQFTGLTLNQVSGGDWDKIIYPPDHAAAIRKYKRHFSYREPVVLEYRLKNRHNEFRWVLDHSIPRYNKEGHFDGYIGSIIDIHERKLAEEKSHFQVQVMQDVSEGIISTDASLNIVAFNRAAETITGLKASEVIGMGLDNIFPGFAGSPEYTYYINALGKGVSSNFEHFLPSIDRWLEISVYPFPQGAFIYLRDITDRKKQERLLELEKQVLEINAQPATSLKTTIDYFLIGLEKIFTRMTCSVIVLSDDRQTMVPLAGPNIPEEVVRSVDGRKIGPAVGSCGTAIYRKEKVITVDIETDALWAELREVARKNNLRSCWSFPIVSAGNEVLATIAVYHRYPAAPTESELNLFERVCSLLRVIIENKNADLKIRLSNERYLLVTKATNDAIWDWDVNTNTLYWGEGIYTLFGFKPGYINNSNGFWENCIHPEDRDRVVNGLDKFIQNSTSQIWEDEYRFIKPNGEYSLVFDRGFLIFDHSGKIARMVGSMQDITDKKELEKKLLKQEVDKQKLIAQAVVNAQEKERAEIGKELHDNVNQILSTAKLYLELAQTDDTSRLELISRSTNNISVAINEIRTISRSLVPPSIGDLGLIDSLQDLVENVKATRKLHVEFYYTGTIDNILDEKRKLMLFRIIQEQVNNVLKHASASNLVIELIADSEGHTIDLTISDDGKGFELDKVRAKKGVGLSNIASRAQLFNGSVHIVTAPGEGCKLKLNVPISNI